MRILRKWRQINILKNPTYFLANKKSGNMVNCLQEYTLWLTKNSDKPHLNNTTGKGELVVRLSMLHCDLFQLIVLRSHTTLRFVEFQPVVDKCFYGFATFGTQMEKIKRRAEAGV